MELTVCQQKVNIKKEFFVCNKWNHLTVQKQMIPGWIRNNATYKLIGWGWG